MTTTTKRTEICPLTYWCWGQHNQPERRGAEQKPRRAHFTLLSRWPTTQRTEADQENTLGAAATQTSPGIGPAEAAGMSAAGNAHPQLGKDALLWFRWKWGGERKRGRRERFNMTHKTLGLGLVWNRYLNFLETECAYVCCSEAPTVLLLSDFKSLCKAIILLLLGFLSLDQTYCTFIHINLYIYFILFSF